MLAFEKNVVLYDNSRGIVSIKKISKNSYPSAEQEHQIGSWTHLEYLSFQVK